MRTSENADWGLGKIEPMSLERLADTSDDLDHLRRARSAAIEPGGFYVVVLREELTGQVYHQLNVALTRAVSNAGIEPRPTFMFMSEGQVRDVIGVASVNANKVRAGVRAWIEEREARGEKIESYGD